MSTWPANPGPANPGMETADIVIIGGGIIGSAIAYFITGSPDFSGRLVVVERDPTYSRNSTPRSLGGVRQQFSTLENIQIGLFGRDFVRQAHAHLAVDGDAPHVNFRENGYLYMVGEKGRPILRELADLQRSHGADVSFLEPSEISEHYPELNVSDIAAGTLSHSGEGWVDPYALMIGFRKKAIAQGAHYIAESGTGIGRQGNRLTDVTTDAGRRIAAGTVVNAAGPQAGMVAALCDVDLPVRPRKRQVLVFECRQDFSHYPLTISPSGLYFRPEGKHYLVGISPGEGEPDPDTEDLELDQVELEEYFWPLLAERMPPFEAIKFTTGWAGHYEVNTLDHNGIIGPHDEVENFYFANGFSGHGVQQSPAVGRAISELILTGRFQTLDLTRLGYARIRAGDPLRERNVT